MTQPSASSDASSSELLEVGHDLERSQTAERVRAAMILRKKIDENRITLNEDTRKKELDEDKIRKETRSKERLARHDEEPRVYRLTLDTVDKPNLQLIMYPGKLAEAKKNGTVPKVDSDAAPDADSDLPDGATADGDTKDPLIDAERDEALNILADLIQLSNGPKTASASTNR